MSDWVVTFVCDFCTFIVHSSGEDESAAISDAKDAMMYYYDIDVEKMYNDVSVKLQ